MRSQTRVNALYRAPRNRGAELRFPAYGVPASAKSEVQSQVMETACTSIFRSTTHLHARARMSRDSMRVATGMLTHGVAQDSTEANCARPLRADGAESAKRFWGSQEWRKASPRNFENHTHA